MTDASLRRTFLSDVPPDSRVSGPLHATNIEGPGRSISIGSGLTMAVLAARKGGVVGAVLGLTGAVVFLRGLTGRDPIKEMMRSDTPKKQFAKSQGWSNAEIVHGVVNIGRPRQELYETWRDFSNLSKFMENIHQIEVRDPTNSHWTVQAPFGKIVEWDAIVTEDVPGERIAWETAPGASIKSAGWVEFKDAVAGRGTEVRARFAYESPAGALGVLVAKLTQNEPSVQARRDLKRFKQFVETGEVSTSKAGPAAPRG